MAQKLLDVQGAPLSSGIHPALPNQSVPLWEDSSNVLFEDAAIKPIPSHESLFIKASSERVLGIYPTYETGPSQSGVLWGTNTKLYDGLESDIPNPNDVTRVSGNYALTNNQLWSFVQFGSERLAANGAGGDELQYQSGEGVPFVDIYNGGAGPGDVPIKAEILHATGAFLLAFNTDNDPTEVRWCDEDDVLTWTPTPTNKARDLQIRDLDSEIIAVVDMADVMVVIGDHQLHTLSFIGAPTYFQPDHLISGIGAVSKHGCTTVGRTIYGFGQNGIWRTDGSSFDFIDHPSMHSFIYGDEGFGEDYYKQIVCWQDPDNNMIYWSGPVSANDGLTIGWDWSKSLWTKHAYWRTAASAGKGWMDPVTGDEIGNVWSQNASGGTSGTPIPLRLDDAIVGQLGYGFGGYGGLGYGGTISATNP